MDGLRRRIEQGTPPREKISTSVELPLSEDAKRVIDRTRTKNPTGSVIATSGRNTCCSAC